MSREDQYNVNVKINNVDYGTYDNMSGGATEASTTKHRPGGMGKEKAYGGSQKVTDITVKRVYEFDRDHPHIATLRALCGKGRAIITKQPLDIDGNVSGLKPEVYTAILASVTPPDADSESEDVGMIELQFSADGSVA